MKHRLTNYGDYPYITFGVKRILERFYGLGVEYNEVSYTVSEDREQCTITLHLEKKRGA